MARIHYERLSNESAAYLEMEQSRRRTHTSMILVFEPGPLATAEVGVDFERIREIIAARLVDLPRLRSKLRRVPLDGHPVWVDDREFDLDHHLRHSSLPRPGNREQLCRTAARIAASRLDRSRPLWDCWIIEGLEDGRFACVLKMHKALASLEGADLFRAILSPDEARVSVHAQSYNPRPAPSPVELFTEEVLKGWSPSRRAIERGLRWFQTPGGTSRALQNQAVGVLRVMGYQLRPAGESPFDGNLGPHRTFAIHGVDLDALQRVRKALGGTVHDLVLTLLSGALRRLLLGRHVSPVTVDLRAVTPVLEGTGIEARPWIVELPIWESSASARLDTVREQTRRIRANADVASGDVMTAGETWNASKLFAIGATALGKIETGQLAILQSPGPQKPLFLDGARLAECYGILPLRDSSALGITVLSYAGRLFFAFNAEADIVPDVRDLAQAVDLELAELLEVATAQGPVLRAVGTAPT